MKKLQIFVAGVVLAGCGSSASVTVEVDAGGDAHVSVPCTNAQLQKGCVAGTCKVTATGSPLPEGGTLTVTQEAVPDGLKGDTVGDFLCSIAVSHGVTSVSGLTLSMTETTTGAADAVLFQYVSPALSDLITASVPAGSDVVGLVTAPGEYGVTKAPGSWTPAGAGGISVLSSADEASLLLNLSSQGMYGAYYDGTHLFVCNGPRLLIYNGVPASPTVAPAVVLGQPDLDTLEPQTTSSLFGGFCSSIWSDGRRLVVAQGSRILIWESIPTANRTPADLVLGQSDFSSNVENSGGVSAASLLVPDELDSNGNNLVVADTFNNRFLVWNEFPTVIDQPADLVIGQADFVSNQGSGAVVFNRAEGVALSSKGMFAAGYAAPTPGLLHFPPVTANNPTSDFTALPYVFNLDPIQNAMATGGTLAVTPSGGLAASDSFLARIAMMNTIPIGPASIDFVLGQPAINYVVESPVSASVVQSLPSNAPVLGTGKEFTIVDGARLLLFGTSPSYNFAPASGVLGQAGFTTNGTVDYRGISASTLAGPADVAFSNGIVAVADEGNNRVLLYKSSDLAANNFSASIVVGQPNATSYNPNLGKSTAGAGGMSGPAGVALDGTHLIVSDTENHRVLIWNTVPAASGVSADLVLGQIDFTGQLPNHGNGDTNGDGFSEADGIGFFYPTGVASDGTHLFVADRVNHRVLVWNTFPTENGQPADNVLGQPGFTSVQPNASGGGYVVVANGFNLPTGVTLTGTSLWVADTENNRVVRWDNVTTAPAPGAFLGQATGTAVANPNYGIASRTGLPTAPTTTTTSMLRPRAVVVAGDQLYVSETDSNRVHIFGATSLAPVGELGQTVDTANAPNAGGVTAASLATPEGVASDGTYLWVADSANHRVLGYGLTTDPTTGAAATVVLGQLALLTNGFDQSSTAVGGVTSQPRGMSVAGDKLYVADTGNHRVLVFATPLKAGEPPSKVYGQPSGTLALSNSGGAASASTLSAPDGVFSDGKQVFIADTGNNRVLVYDASATSIAATLVLGQSSFTATAANSGGATASTMQEPSGVYFDGTRLWVADMGNHRVLLWNKLPTSSGQPADVVLGQPSFADVLPNQGGSATAKTMSFPTAIQLSNGVVYIADSGNNRVLMYSSVPTASGASASGVLGQPNLTSRLAATSPVDLTTLAGPVGLAADAENLYVVDRDLSRALVYHVGTLKSGAPAFLALGAAGGLSISGPGGIAVETTPYFNSEVYVGNTGGNDVAIVTGVTRLVTP
jgi:sugar lactone lactonase YvrE